MMIKGIGVDIVEIKRLNIENRRFIEKILTNNEIDCFNQLKNNKNKLEFLAGRFAAKEAYLKAKQIGIGEMSFHDIEILNKLNGAPYLNDKKALISISHEKNYAIAMVLLQE